MQNMQIIAATYPYARFYNCACNFLFMSVTNKLFINNWLLRAGFLLERQIYFRTVKQYAISYRTRYFTAMFTQGLLRSCSDADESIAQHYSAHLSEIVPHCFPICV